jgi:hypothetical protein
VSSLAAHTNIRRVDAALNLQSLSEVEHCREKLGFMRSTDGCLRDQHSGLEVQLLPTALPCDAWLTCM